MWLDYQFDDLVISESVLFEFTHELLNFLYFAAEQVREFQEHLHHLFLANSVVQIKQEEYFLHLFV